MVNIFDIGYEMFHGLKNIGKPNLKYEVYESQLGDTNGKSKPVEPTNVISIYTASKILSSSFSQMPIKITKNDVNYEKFRLYYELVYRMNNIQNNQAFWSTLEYYRNVYGNSFVDIRKNINKIIHPALISDFKITENVLYFYVLKEINSTDGDWVNSNDLLHFKGMSIDGIFGLPPVLAAAQSMQIMDKASNTIISFYDNKAMSPLALESTIQSAAGTKATLEGIDIFNSKYTSSFNAGKPMQLPANTKLTPLQLHFADAELIDTMKFTKDEIYTMYRIPAFMTSNQGDKQTDIENQTLSYKMFTLAPIVKIYEEELSYKLLTKQERLDKVEINYDMDSLVETDLKTKVTAYRDMVTSGLMTPNEAADKLGTEGIKGASGDKHMVQAQYIFLEDLDSGKVNNISPIIKKDSPIVEKITKQ